MSDSHDSHSQGDHSHSHGRAAEPAAGPKPGGWWFWPALLGVLLIGGIWWYLSQTHVVTLAPAAHKTAEGVGGEHRDPTEHSTAGR